MAEIAGQGDTSVPALTERGLALVQELSGLMRDYGRALTEATTRNDQLEHMVAIDVETGLLNPRGLAIEVEREEARAVRTHGEAAVAILRVAGTEVTDAAVEQALMRAVAAGVRANCRATDVVARTAPRELVVLLPDARRNGAEAFVDRIRRRITLVALTGVPAFPVLFTVFTAGREEASPLSATLGLARRRADAEA